MLPEETETKLQIPEEERKKIVRLMRRVSRRSYLHQIINRRTGEILPASEAASGLVALLNTTPETKWRQRLVAAIALRYVPIAATEESPAALALGRTLKTEYMERVGNTFIRWFWCLLVMMAGTLISAKIYDETGEFLFLKLVLLLIGVFMWVVTPLVFFISPIRIAARNAEVHVAAAETLALLQLPESVGALAKASRGKKHLADVTRRALTQLLPTLTEAHYGQLPNDTTPELCALLFDADTSERLISLTVEAIGKVGDGRAVEPVHQFARAAQTQELHELAKSILPILIARREQENASSTLLSHSSEPPADAAQLLRAASASAVTPPKLLLRPSLRTKSSAEDAEDAEN